MTTQNVGGLALVSTASKSGPPDVQSIDGPAAVIFDLPLPPDCDLWFLGALLAVTPGIKLYNVFSGTMSSPGALGAAAAKGFEVRLFECARLFGISPAGYQLHVVEQPTLLFVGVVPPDWVLAGPCGVASPDVPVQSCVSGATPMLDLSVLTVATTISSPEFLRLLESGRTNLRLVDGYGGNGCCSGLAVRDGTVRLVCRETSKIPGAMYKVVEMPVPVFLGAFQSDKMRVASRTQTRFEVLTENGKEMLPKDTEAYLTFQQ